MTKLQETLKVWDTSRTEAKTLFRAMFGSPMRSVPVMSDFSLITAHRSGDSAAFRALMARHHDSVMGFLVNRVGDDAEDLFQETWARVAKSLDSYQDAGSFRAWVLQIARRLVIDHHRRKGARVKLVLSEDALTPSATDHAHPFHNITASEIADALQQALDAMPPLTAEVVRMRMIEGVPFKAIADHQDVPLNTALGRMHRGLNQVRSTLLIRGLIEE